MWHCFFHNAQNNLAESLTAGRERLHLQHFFERLAFNPEAIGLEDLNRYAVAFEAAGAMRAGFELYRAFAQDAEENRAALKKSGKLTKGHRRGEPEVRAPGRRGEPQAFLSEVLDFTRSRR